MAFKLPKYIEPDFTQEKFVNAPEATLVASPRDKSAPDYFHATSIFPEYFKIDGKWLLAEDTRMDCVAVYENGKIYVREFRNVKQGDMIVIGRTENCEEGIYVHADCFETDKKKDAQALFRETFSRHCPMTCYSSCPL